VGLEGRNVVWEQVASGRGRGPECPFLRRGVAMVTTRLGGGGGLVYDAKAPFRGSH